MTTIAGFPNVVLQGLGLAGLATALGGVAFALLELRLPPPNNRVPGRVWAVAFVLVGALLLSYREGYG